MMQKWTGEHFEDHKEFTVNPGDHTSHYLTDDVLYRAVPLIDAEHADEWIVPDPIEWLGCDQAHCDYTFVYIEIGVVAFADVAISRRYGSDVFIDGQLSGIKESDEICIKYFRPEDGAVLNLPGELHDYIYLKGTSGTYSFDGNPHIPLWVRRIVPSRFEGDVYIPSHYIDTCLPGWYALLVHDVSGTCETVISERISHPFELIAPRYQYQVVFDPDSFDFPDQLHLLAGRLAQWDTVDDMVLDRSIDDCWVVKVRRAGVWDAEYSHVWLCATAQLEVDAFCYPLPYWLCQRDPIVHKYWRGECDCEEFQMYRKYGIPCCHLLAVMDAYGDKPARCPYVQCP
jgi:hypothetical protein